MKPEDKAGKMSSMISRITNSEPVQDIIERHSLNLVNYNTYGEGDTLLTGSNMLIFADNLAALTSLVKDYGMKGKVMLVYIDPPFATNTVFRAGEKRVSTISSSSKDESAYHDTKTGREYLEFLKSRLMILRDLLAQNGSIYLHIDAKMGHYVKVLMDDVFGEKNFISDITRIKSNPKNFARRAFGNIKDTVLFYSKTDNYVWNESRESMTEEDIARLFPKVNRSGRRYTTNPLHAPGETKQGPSGSVWRGISPPPGRHWRYHPDVLTKLDESGLIEWSKSGVPRKIIYADEKIPLKKRQDVWEFKDSPYPTYPTEKNLDMLKMIIETSSNKEDLVLDCFCGSGSTLLAAELLGRKWIGIDNSPVAMRTTFQTMNAVPNHKVFCLYVDHALSFPETLKEIVNRKVGLVRQNLSSD